MSIRKLLGNIVGALLVFGWRCFGRFDCRKQLLSLYLHNPQKSVFENVICYLQKQGFHFISTKELEEVISQKRELNQRTAVVTLDDAWRDNLVNVVPVAEQYKIPIAIFAPIQPVEEGVLWLKWFRDKELQSQFLEITKQDPKKLPTSERNLIWNRLKNVKQFEREMMSVDEVKELSTHALVTIGGHTYTHPILPNCAQDEMEYELVSAREKLREMTGIETDVMAYPNGDFNDTVISVCRKAGFSMAFTTQEGLYIDIDKTDSMRLPRNCVPNAFGKWESRARALGVWQRVFSK